MIGIAYFAFFVTALLLSIGCTWFVRNLAVRRNWVRDVQGRRNVHTAPIPRLGGVGLFIAFNVSLALLVAGYHVIGRNPVYLTETLSTFLLPSIAIFVLGLADDIFDVPVWVKFGVQTAAAVLLFEAGLRVNPSIFGSHHISTALSLALTILWVVGITNAFNLIDGLDGLAAGSALFSTTAVFMLGVMGGNRTVAMITLGLTGAILGFLRFNFNPATIFLGDSGSLFIGFMLSAISLASSQKSPTLVAVAIPVVACGLPLLDTSIAIARRFLNGKSLFGADKEHIHHKLMDRGLTQRQAVIVLYAVSAFCAFMSMLLLSPGAATYGVVLAVMGIGAWLGLQQLDYREINELKRLARRTVDQKQIIANNLSVQCALDNFPTANSFSDVSGLLEGMFAKNDFDGFELIVASASEPESEFHHRWQKPQTTDSAGRWSLTIRLVSDDGLEQGQLTINRAYSAQPLLVDINLITIGFPGVLGDALAKIKNYDRAQDEDEPGVQHKTKAISVTAGANH